MEILKALANLTQFRFVFSVICLINAILVNGAGDLWSQSSSSTEYQIKAVFLFNFTQFVEWPEQAFTGTEKQHGDSGSPLIIGLFGEDPYGNFLDKIIEGEQMNNHPLEVKRFSRIQEIENCHILYIAQSEENQMQKVIRNMKNSPTLTVSDISNFSNQGGMIQFVKKENRIRLLINIEAAKTSGLTISSKLLSLAEIESSDKKETDTHKE
jgi:hypothetical protein